MKFFEFIAANGKSLHKQAGEYIFKQGDEDTSIYVVKSGLIKAYYLSADGKENIKSFIMPGDNIGSILAGYADEKCPFSLVCLKDCELIVIKFKPLYEASQSDPELAMEMVNFLLQFAIKKEIREYELLCLSAEERYSRLIETAPNLLNLVTQNEIARYLGVTPVGLSRIKKRLKQ